MKHTEQMLQKMKFVTDGGDRTEIPENIRPQTGKDKKQENKEYLFFIKNTKQTARSHHFDRSGLFVYKHIENENGV